MLMREIKRYLVPHNIFKIVAGLFLTVFMLSGVGLVRVNAEETATLPAPTQEGFVIDEENQTAEENIIIYHDELVDSYTGKTYSELAAMADQGKNYDAPISENCSYDARRDRFVYSYAGFDEAVVANVADGMVVNSKVEIQVSDKMDYTLYCNGSEISVDDMRNITKPGAYTLHIGGKQNGINVLTFQIVGRYSNITNFMAPSGFMILSVLKDDAPLYTSTNIVSLTDEGHYYITYFCRANEKDYYFDIYIDHTAPVLALAEVNEKGFARGPVDISDALNEENVQMLIKRDGVQIEYARVLKESGSYTIDIADQAGNISSYQFTILVYLNMSSVMFVFGFVLLIAGVIAYAITARKRLRVR